MFCMLCGSPTREVKGKLVCDECHRIAEGCCEGAGEKAQAILAEMEEIAAELNAEYGKDAISLPSPRESE